MQIPKGDHDFTAKWNEIVTLNANHQNHHFTYTLWPNQTKS